MRLGSIQARDKFVNVLVTRLLDIGSLWTCAIKNYGCN
jgi:hypothetical protein